VPIPDAQVEEVMLKKVDGATRKGEVLKLRTDKGLVAFEDRMNNEEGWEHVFPRSKGPADPIWLDDSAVVFFEVTFDKVPTASNLKKKPFLIEWKNDRWNDPRPLK
jgi:hypothetical protein